jgi:sec-independent protein translocase protein TatA
MNTILAVGPIGGPEMIVIFLVVLLLFGAKKLPELARGVGKSMGEFKKARDDFEREITRSEVEARVDKRPSPREDYDRDPVRTEPEARVREAVGKESREA